MALLQENNAIYYHPLDDQTEFLKTDTWSTLVSNVLFTDGIITSGLTRNNITTGVSFEEALSNGPYSDIDTATSITTCFWASGFYGSSSSFKTITIGLEDNAGLQNNILSIQKTNADVINVKLKLRNTTSIVNTPSIVPSTNDWHFVVIEGRRESSNWRLRVSFNGSGWQDLGTMSLNAAPSANTRLIIDLADTSSTKFVIDEIAFWKDTNLFTSQELSNLYELTNTHSATMDQYTSIFPTPINKSLDLFLSNKQSNKSLDLFIASSFNTNKNFNLFINAIGFTSNNTSLFLNNTKVENSIDLFTNAVFKINNNINLFTNSSIVLNNNIDLFVNNQQFNNNIDIFTTAFDKITNSTTLFVRGILFISTPVFVNVSDNIVNHDISLFVHAVASGSPSNIKFINNGLSLFTINDGSNKTSTDIWNIFVKTDPSPLTLLSTWNVLVGGGNQINDKLTLCTKGHIGSDVLGIEINNDISYIIQGAGDLISDGFVVLSSIQQCFIGTQNGLSNNIDFYISGFIFPSNILDLYLFGITNNINYNASLFVIGNSLLNIDELNLYTTGILGTINNNVTLFLNTTDIGNINIDNSLYTHGF